MMPTALKIVLAAVVVAAAVVASVVQRRRRNVSAPTQPRGLLPVQVDRKDFPHADTPWCVIVFSSATCHTCASVLEKARVLECAEVAVVDVEFSANRELHKRYEIDAVPGVVVVDRDGIVRASFAGPVTATDLWAAVAECRNPGSSPEPELGR